MIVILHDSSEEASRAFAAAHGEGYKVIDRAKEPEKFDTFVCAASANQTQFKGKITLKRLVAQ